MSSCLHLLDTSNAPHTSDGQQLLALVGSNLQKDARNKFELDVREKGQFEMLYTSITSIILCDGPVQ